MKVGLLAGFCFTLQGVAAIAETTRSSATADDVAASETATTTTKTTTSPDAWKILDDRPLPDWYDNAKFGIFIHWGVFAVPSFGSEWFWWYWEGKKSPEYLQFIDQTERPGFSYTEYAARFKAELYRPDEWADIFARSGAQYVVLTSKHHEGFCMWNSTRIPTTWNWNAVQVGPRRDLVGELRDALEKVESPHTGRPLEFGLYHSLFEWFNPLFLADLKANLTTDVFVREKTLAELYDLVDLYKPSLIWSDGDWGVPSPYWKATEFLYWYGFQSPVADKAVWNDRWGSDTGCQHGGFLTCEDRYRPGKLKNKKWENCFTIDMTSWGLNRNSTFSEYMSVKEIIDLLIETVAFNGNVLLNVGPAADGTIHPIFVDRLLGIGAWLKVNGVAIYNTRPWLVCQSEEASHVFYTRDQDSLYVHMTQWPSQSLLHLDCPVATADTTVRFLGLEDEEDYHIDVDYNTRTRIVATTTTKSTSGGVDIMIEPLTPDRVPCQHAWVLVLAGISNLDQPNTAEVS